MSRNITQIIVHCSASSFGDAETINKWHIERKMSSIGYHFVILNGCRSAHSDPASILDGKIETGRPVEQIGAHCIEENHNSIGICLIGENRFTDKQFKSLDSLLSDLMKKYNIPIENVRGHYETDSGKKQGKTCPNFGYGKI